MLLYLCEFACVCVCVSTLLLIPSYIRAQTHTDVHKSNWMADCRWSRSSSPLLLHTSALILKKDKSELLSHTSVLQNWVTVFWVFAPLYPNRPALSRLIEIWHYATVLLRCPPKEISKHKQLLAEFCGAAKMNLMKSSRRGDADKQGQMGNCCSFNKSCKYECGGGWEWRTQAFRAAAQLSGLARSIRSTFQKILFTKPSCVWWRIIILSELALICIQKIHLWARSWGRLVACLKLRLKSNLNHKLSPTVFPNSSQYEKNQQHRWTFSLSYLPRSELSPVAGFVSRIPTFSLKTPSHAPHAWSGSASKYIAKPRLLLLLHTQPGNLFSKYKSTGWWAEYLETWGTKYQAQTPAGSV